MTTNITIIDDDVLIFKVLPDIPDQATFHAFSQYSPIQKVDTSHVASSQVTSYALKPDFPWSTTHINVSGISAY